MEPVTLTKIDKIIPIFREGNPANAIEVIRIENCEFNIIAGKGLYKIGDPVVYIMPDYCLPDNDLFFEYWRPEGLPSKSKLGKKGRTRAVKFNFQFENETEPIYSNGIVLPVEFLKQHGINLEAENLMEEFGIIKYVSEDSHEKQTQHKGMVEAPLPSFLYSTDEPRGETMKKHVNQCFEDGETLGFSLKRDGSSITIFVKKAPIEEGFHTGICSRKQEKKLDQKMIKGYKNLTTAEPVELHPFFNKETKIRGWMDDVADKFLTDEEIKTLPEIYEPIMVDVKDAWVDTCKKHNYFNDFIAYCVQHDIELSLRGELIGQGNKGSGNKLNQDAQGESRVVWFGVDDLSTGFSKRINYSQKHNLKEVCEELNFDYTKHVLEGVFDYDSIIKACNEIFAKVKAETGQVVEGMVMRTINSNRLSFKYINPEYDSKA